MSKLIQMTVSDDLYAAIKENAVEDYLTVSGFCRTIVARFVIGHLVPHDSIKKDEVYGLEVVDGEVQAQPGYKMVVYAVLDEEAE